MPISRVPFPRITPWLIPLLIATAIRLPGVWAGQFDYDEGVYWASLRSLSAGHHLFSEVFSSQPPGFLPAVLPFYDLLGHSLAGARTGVLVFSLVGIAATYIVANALGGRSVAVGAALAAAVDPLLTRQAVTLQAENVCLGLGMLALAFVLVARRREGRSRIALAFLGGAALAAACLVKLLAVAFVPPVLIALLMPVTTRPDRLLQRVRLAAGAALGGLLVSAVIIAPYAGSLSAVWTQSVGMHLASNGINSSWTLDLFGTVLVHDIPLALIACVGIWWLWRTRRQVAVLLLVWEAGAALVDVGQHPLWPHHLAVLVPALTVAAGGAVPAFMRLRKRSGAALLIVVAVVSLVIAEGNLGHQVTADTAPDTVSAIEQYTAAQQLVVTDDQYAVSTANRDIPPQLVDTSIVRQIGTSLQASDVEAIIVNQHVGAILFGTSRLDRLSGFREWVHLHYPVELNLPEGRTLYVER